MENPGEHLVGQYLKYIKECDFVEYNLLTKPVQGEIDVVGINSNKMTVYLCEVATHLTGKGLQYVDAKRNSPDNVNRLTNKFVKDIEYADRNFKDFEKRFMLWTPIARSSKMDAKTNPLRDLQEIRSVIVAKYGITLDIVANDEYLKAINELRIVASHTRQEMSSPIMRFLQIEEKLKKILTLQAKKRA